MAEQPNDASRKSKAEGDRWDTDSEQTRDQSTDDQGGGITNPPLDQETSNQQAVPSSDVGNRQLLETPRRYDQPIEDDDDPVMPSGDTTLATKI